MPIGNSETGSTGALLAVIDARGKAGLSLSDCSVAALLLWLTSLTELLLTESPRRNNRDGEGEAGEGSIRCIAAAAAATAALP